MKISSPFEMRGSLGNFTFFVNEYGQQAKEGGGPTASQVKTNERFDRTRRNAAEWKGTTAASRLFRLAMGHLLEPVNNIRLSSRMNGWLLPAIKADTVHVYGKRVISSGDFSLLPGFEFNHNLKLDDALPFNINNHYSLEAGKLLVDVPAFRIRKKKGLPAGATHYRLVSSIVTIDFDKRKHQQDKQVGALCKMGNKAGTAFSIEHIVQPPNEQGCFWLMGIEFYRMVNDEPVVVRGGALKVMEWVGKVGDSYQLQSLPRINGVGSCNALEESVNDDKLIECVTVKAEVAPASVVIPENGVSCPSAGLAGFVTFFVNATKKVTKEKARQTRMPSRYGGTGSAVLPANSSPCVASITNYKQVDALGVATHGCFWRAYSGQSYFSSMTAFSMVNFQGSIIREKEPGGP